MDLRGKPPVRTPGEREGDNDNGTQDGQGYAPTPVPLLCSPSLIDAPFLKVAMSL
jgi:hypothetical protein